MENLRNLLNEKQYEAVTSTAKYLRIIAGAGSGKTRVLTYRIAYLIDTLNYYPSSILAITFTNKAAEEIRNRIESTLKMGHLRMNISTFHSFCARILREECKILNYPSSFTILDDDDQKKIIKDIINELEYDSKLIKITNILDYISNKKTKGISPLTEMKLNSSNELGAMKAKLYHEYQIYLAKNFAFDFDDLILESVKLFEENPEVLVKWQHRLRHILVDEFQDVDPIQYKLLTLLAGKGNEVTVVGDPDQTIYTWRGADVRIILNFERDFEGCETISLEENYRSTGNILKVANTLIEHNDMRIKKNLFTNAEMGVDIARFEGENEYKEAQYVVNNIKDLYDGSTNMYKDFAILYRANSQTQVIEQVLMDCGIKYKIYGGIKFYHRAEIKDAISYLRIANNLNDNLAFLRIIENSNRGIGKATLEKLKANADTENVSIFEHLKNNLEQLKNIYHPRQGNQLQAFVKQISELHDFLLLEPNKAHKILDDHLHKYGYFDMLIHYELDEKIENLHQFIKQISMYFKKEEATLSEFIQNVTLMSSQDDINEDNSNDYIKLMTIHTAKGLEFKNVFVFGLVEGIFPSSRSIMETGKNGLEEERRLLYVAMTRAKKRLFLSTSGGFSYMGARVPSRFLREIQSNANTQKVLIRNDNLSVENNSLLFKPGSIIKHDIFGEGIVISENEGLIKVAFHDSTYGIKTLNSAHKFVHLIK